MNESNLSDIIEKDEVLSDGEISSLIDVFEERKTDESVGEVPGGVVLEILDTEDEDEAEEEIGRRRAPGIRSIGKKEDKAGETDQLLTGLESKQSSQKVEIFFNELCSRLKTILSSSITNLLQKVSVSAERLSIEQSAYGEIVHSVLSATKNSSCIILFPFKDEALKVPDMVEIDLDLAFAMIDLFLGGDAFSIPDKGKITDFERDIISKMMTKMKSDFANLLHPSLELEDSPPRVVNYMDLGDIPHQVRPIISLPIRLTLEINHQTSISGNFVVHIPYSIIEREKLYVDNLDRENLKGAKKLSQTSIQEKAMDIPLNLQVCFPPRTITVGELLNLQEEDIIKLNTTLEDKLNVKLQEENKFLGEPLLIGKNQKAVEISDLPQGWDS